MPLSEDGRDFMLFGYRVKVDRNPNPNPIRKSVSMNDLTEYEPEPEPVNAEMEAGYASANDAAPHRKRGSPWTEEEHKLFLIGLHKVGKGDWKGISRNYVKTRTPTQVASHAQKYFIRRSNTSGRHRRRSSLFDITTDSVAEEANKCQEIPAPVTCVFSPVTIAPGENSSAMAMLVHHFPFLPMPGSSRLKPPTSS